MPIADRRKQSPRSTTLSFRTLLSSVFSEKSQASPKNGPVQNGNESSLHSALYAEYDDIHPWSPTLLYKRTRYRAALTDVRATTEFLSMHQRANFKTTLLLQQHKSNLAQPSRTSHDRDISSASAL